MRDVLLRLELKIPPTPLPIVDCENVCIESETDGGASHTDLCPTTWTKLRQTTNCQGVVGLTVEVEVWIL